MKKIAFVVGLLALPAMVFGQSATLSLVDNATGLNSVAVDPVLGGTVTAALLVSYAGAAEGVANVDGIFQASQSGKVTITGRTYGSPFQAGDSWAAPGAAFYGAVNGAMNPNSKNFGVASTSFVGSGPGGNYVAPADGALPWKIFTMTLSVAGPVNSPIVISMPGAFVGTTVNDGLDPVQLSTQTFGLTITPEPATMLLLAGAIPFLRRRSA